MGDLPDIPCREVSVELLLHENTDEGERGYQESRRRRRRDECEVSEMERERRRRHEEDNKQMDSSTLPLAYIGDLPDIPCREVSFELIRFQTLMMERTSRERRRGETRVSVGSEMERWRWEETRGSQHGWTVVHHWCHTVTLPTSHAERSPLN